MEKKNEKRKRSPRVLIFAGTTEGTNSGGIRSVAGPELSYQYGDRIRGEDTGKYRRN